MKDKFKEFMDKGSTVPTSPAPEQAKEPIQPKTAPEPVKEPVKTKDQSVVPTPVARPVVEPKTDPKTEPKPEKIPRENFAVLEEKAKKSEQAAIAAEAKAEELRKQIEAMPKFDAEKIAEKEKQLAQYQIIVDKFYVEHSPQFQATYDAKIGDMKERAKRIVSGEQGEALEAILQLPEGKHRDKQFKELASALEDEYDRGSLRDIYRDLTDLQLSRSKDLANAPENFKKLKEFEAEQQAKEHQKQDLLRSDALSSVVKDLQSYIPEFQVIAGDKEHNALVDENIDLAKRWLNPGLTHSDAAKVAAYAVKGYRAMEGDLTKDKLIATLQDQLKELQSIVPTTNGSTRLKGGRTGPAIKSPVDKFNYAMQHGVPAKDE